MHTSFRLIFWPLVLVLTCWLGAGAGSIDTTAGDVWRALTSFSPDRTIDYIILNIRVPRIMLAFLTGAALALSGFLMQAMVNNPLADPYILGTASGASLGVNISYLGAIPFLSASVYSSSVAAFAGALLITLTGIAVAYDKGGVQPARLLLAGVALSSLSIAVTTMLIYVYSSDNKLKKVIFWSMGSLESASWEKIPLLAFFLILSTIVFAFFTPQLTILLLGDSRAASLGVHVNRLRWFILLGATLLTALAVAVAGPVGFIGLMVPHFVRGLWGVHNKYIILDCVLSGGVFLSMCDSVGKIVFRDISLPIGIITSFLGIPFFVYLLTKKNFRFS